MAQNDIFQVSIVTNVGGKDTANVLHVQQTTASPTSDEETDIEAALTGSTFYSNLQGRLSNESTITCIKVALISPTTRPGSYFTRADVGGVASPTHPPQSSVQLYLAAPPFARRNIGQHFFSGVPISAVNDGKLTKPAWDLWQAVADEMENPITNTGTYEFGVWSEKFSEFQALGVARARQIIKVLRDRRSRPCV